MMTSLNNDSEMLLGLASITSFVTRVMLSPETLLVSTAFTCTTAFPLLMEGDQGHLLKRSILCQPFFSIFWYAGLILTVYFIHLLRRYWSTCKIVKSGTLYKQDLFSHIDADSPTG